MITNNFIGFIENIPGGETWFIQVAVVFVLTMIAYSIKKFVYYRLVPKFQKQHKVWSSCLLGALNAPMSFFIWILGAAISFEIIQIHINDPIINRFLAPIRDISIAIVSIWFLIRLVKKCEYHFIDERRGTAGFDETSARAIAQIARIAVIIIGALILMQMLGVKTSGVVAFGGVSAAAIAFAAKDMLGNFFGAIMIYFDRPFSVGDWIRSPDRNIEGTVEYIGWRLTRIRTFDKRPLYVPNGIFNTISVENPSRMQNRRIKTNFGVRYDDANKIRGISQAVEDMLRNHPEIDTNQTLMVYLVNFGPSSLDIMIYTFTKTTNWVKYQEIQQDVFLKVIDIVTQHGGECAFPTTTLHIPNEVHIDMEKNSMPHQKTETDQ